MAPRRVSNSCSASSDSQHSIVRDHFHFVFATAVALALTPRASAQWSSHQYSIQRLGLFSSEYTGSGGRQESGLGFINSAEHIAGYSVRVRDVNTVNGFDAWSFDGSSSVPIGLTTSAHVIGGGYRYNLPTFQNDSGQVAGYSRRYLAGGADNGRDAWVWDGTSTTQVGLVGGAYTGSGGLQYSEVQFQNSSGRLAGYSARYSGVSTDKGRDVWAWNGSSTVPLGFMGGVYLGSTGVQYSAVMFQNDAGQVVGTSKRSPSIFGNTLSTKGQDCWVWGGGTTSVQIGFVGGDYTSPNGTQSSTPERQNRAGQVVGYSTRYTAQGATNGIDAWVWNGATTTQIGLIGGVYSGVDGTRASTPVSQTESGLVTGYSSHYSGTGTNLGQDSWLFTGNSTVQIGLTGGPYVASDGRRSSRPSHLSEDGRVIGYSTRYPEAGASNGQDAWVWNGVSTVQIGLPGGEHTGNGGYQFTNAPLANAQYISGYSNRYKGTNTANGQDAWIWNGLETVQIGLTGGAYTGSSGYQFSKSELLSDSGRVVGTSTDTPAQTRTSAATPGCGTEHPRLGLGSLTESTKVAGIEGACLTSKTLLALLLAGPIVVQTPVHFGERTSGIMTLSATSRPRSLAACA